MNLRREILGWDGKSTEEIGKIYDQHQKRETFVSEIVSLLEKNEYQIGASWLLKRHLERGNSLPAKKVILIYKRISLLRYWETKLHFLQSIPYMPIPSIEKESVENFLRDCLADKNKFIRAWGYGGFYLLADQFPEYREEAKQFIDNAMTNESASIKARIRNVIKTGFLSNE